MVQAAGKVEPIIDTLTVLEDQIGSLHFAALYCQLNNVTFCALTASKLPMHRLCISSPFCALIF